MVEWGLDAWRIEKWCRVGRHARKIKTVLLKPFVLTSSGVLSVQGGVGGAFFAGFSLIYVNLHSAKITTTVALRCFIL